MRSAFNLLVLHNSMSTPFLCERPMCSLEKWHLIMTIIIIIVVDFDAYEIYSH